MSWYAIFAVANHERIAADAITAQGHEVLYLHRRVRAHRRGSLYRKRPFFPQMRQNTSHAVMAQRVEAQDSADDFPTPPWATRALMEFILNDKDAFKHKSCLEPACGAGHMVRVLNEYFGCVHHSDAYDYSFGPVRNFLTYPFEPLSVDWVITNPPFRLGEQFVIRALQVAREGVAILARTVFIESVGRYRNLFQKASLTKFAQFTERVPMIKGRLDRKATTATGYAWLVWEKERQQSPRLMWIPPCRKMLERETDYPP